MLGRIIAAVALCLVLQLSPDGAQAARRIALVIGNDAYESLPALRNAVADARAIAQELQTLGFTVLKGENLSYRATNRLHADFEAQVSPGDTTFVFFAGHGVALGADNYLLPVDMERPGAGEENLVRSESHSVDTLVRQVQARGAAASFFVFDACRDNPFESVGVRSIGSTRGLARVDAPTGVFVLFSAGIGQTALDRLGANDTSPNSVFTRTLVPLLDTPGLSHIVLAKRLQTEVKALAGSVSHLQQPAFYDQIDGEVVFREATKVVAPDVTPAPPSVASSPPAPAIPPVAALAPPPPAVTPPLAATPTPSDERALAAMRPLLDAIVQIPNARVAVAPAAQPASPAPSGKQSDPSLDAFFDEFFKGRGSAGGALGFIIDPSGMVVTNRHVIQDVKNLTVLLRDGTSLSADVIGSDSRTDIALLRVKSGRPLKALVFGNSSKLSVGDPIAALAGPPTGESPLKLGKIRALDLDLSSGPYDRFVGVDVALGDNASGGPLLNLVGEVVGVVTAFKPPDGQAATGGFAIPAAMAANVLDQLRLYGEVRRAWLGVRIQQVTDEIAESLNIKPARGALVAAVEDKGPAKAIGLEAGDVILRFDGNEVKEMRDLPRLVAETPAGKEVEVIAWRKGAEIRKSVRLGRLEEAPAPATPAEQPAAVTRPSNIATAKALGLEFASLNDDLRQRYKVKPSVRGGLLVVSADDQVVKDKRIVVGDVIVEAASKAVSKPADLQKLIEERKKAGSKTMIVMVATADGDVRFVAMNLQ